VFTVVIWGELRFDDFIFVACEAVKELAILSIKHPDHVILPTCDDDVAFRVPLNKVDIIGRSFKSAYQLKVLLNIPYS